MLDHFRVNGTPQKQRSAYVSEIVPAEVGEPCMRWNRLDVPVDNALYVNRRTNDSAKTGLESP